MGAGGSLLGVGGLFRREACLARSKALPGDRLRARGGWEARGKQDAPGPGSARVRVCARWGGAGRVHGTGRTRAGVSSGRCCTEGRRRRVKISRKTGARAPQGVGEGGGRNRADVQGRVRAPAVQRANTEPRRPQIGKNVARVFKHRRRSASPRDLHAPGQRERATARTLARSQRSLRNDNASGY